MSSISDGNAKAYLKQVREWAHAKITAGSEPPWAWYRYMQLREVADHIMASMEATTPLRLAAKDGEEVPDNDPSKIILPM